LVDAELKTKWKIFLSLVLSCLLFLGFAIIYNITLPEFSTKWIRTFDGTNDDEFFSVIECNDFGYSLAGTTNSSSISKCDGWVIKTNSSGVMEWNRTYGGLLNDGFYSLVNTSDGGYTLAGYTNSSGFGKEDVWLVKVDSQGNMDWNRTFGGSESDFGRSLVYCSDGGYLLACETSSFSSEDNDIWVIKTDTTGNMLWNQTYGRKGFQYVFTIIETNDGGYVLACSTSIISSEYTDAWLIKLNSIGNIEWNQTYGGLKNEFANSLVTTDDGGYCFAGSTASFGANRTDVWLVKVNSVGSLEWERTFGGPLLDYCDSLVVTTDGGYLLGYIEQPPFFGNFGEGKFRLAKFNTVGQMEWKQTMGISAPHSEISLLSTIDEDFVMAGSTINNANTKDFWFTKFSKTDTGIVFQLFLLLTIFLILLVIGIFLYRKRIHRP
jgi:hypothetical protein